MPCPLVLLASCLPRPPTLTCTRRKIYFDGFLPPRKWATRRSRLLQQTKGMAAATSTLSFGVGRQRANESAPPRDVFQQVSPWVRNHVSRDLPKHPFLVPAVAEILRASGEYGHLVQVVPGEADTYCASDVRANGGIVLTTDSDLLLEDLGPSGSVAFFWEVNEDPAGGDPRNQELGSEGPGSETPNSEGALVASTYSARDLETRFNLQGYGGMPRLAFEMVSRRVGVPTALDFCRRSDETELATNTAYTKFLEEHMVPQEYISAEHPVIALLSALDPRISELVIQSLNVGTAGPVEEEPQNGGALRGPDLISMFLPVMIEDHARKSAWTMSESVRMLAYAVAQKSGPHRRDIVIEYRTLQTESGGRQLSIPEFAAVDGWCEQLLQTINQLEAGVSDPELLWLAFAVYQDIEWSTPEGRTPLSTVVMSEAAEYDGQPGRYGWDVIHFAAQVQAALYSLRMLKQTLDVMAVLEESTFSKGRDELRRKLQGFPMIVEWPTAETLFGLLLRLDKQPCLATIADMLGVPEASLRVSPEQASQENISKKRKRSSKEKPPRSVAVNPFAILSAEAQAD